MANTIALTAEARERAGKGVARALRRENKVPAVIYGDKKEPVTITLPEKELTLEYRKGTFFTTICEVDVAGTAHKVLARDVQLHPVTDNIEHVDFLRVTDKTKIAVNVPVSFVNEDKAPGLRDGGILSVIRYEIELVCRAVSIPDEIEIDISALEMGEAVKISDVKLPEGAEPAITDRDFTIASIIAPRAVVEEEPEEGEEGAEGEAAEGEDGEEASGEEGGEEASSEE